MYTIRIKAPVIHSSEDAADILKYMDKFAYLYEVRDSTGAVMTVEDLKLESEEKRKGKNRGYRNRYA